LRAFHLHYGEEVLGWARRGDAERARDAVEAWIAGNPPARSDAWHPYSLSLRVGNWLAAATLVPELATAAIAASVAQQARYLARNVEDDVLGNHVIANARALVLAGVALDDASLVRRGRVVLDRELPEQILGDGGHYERSPLYHLLVLRDLLEISAAADVDLDEPIARMLRFATALQRPDGLPAPFNDAPLELAPDLDLGSPPDGTSVFEETGYVVVRHDRWWVAFDCGPPAPRYLPPHAHGDALSVQVWRGERPLVVDPGTYTYEAGADRDWFRSTRAHATATVDGREQFALWGAFRSGPLPAVRLLDAENLTGEARYGGVVHRRTVDVRPDEVVVHDETTGGRAVESRIPLTHPMNLEVDRWDDGWLSEQMYERRRIPVGVVTGTGAVDWRLRAADTL
jgi:uncharacterized heparinase superfamily protein